jgi:hypothetical protein
MDWNTSVEGWVGGKTCGAARVKAVCAKRYVGGRLNTRIEGRGRGVPCEGESMTRAK